MDTISQISCSQDHALLLSTDRKTVWALGSNVFAQLGFATTELTSTSEAIKIPFLGRKTIKKLQCDDTSSVVLTAEGKIIMWGDFEARNRQNPHIPRFINIEKKVIDISMGDGFMLALTADNRLFAFGSNDRGQCGQGTIGDFIEDPVEVKLHNLRIKEISAGKAHCLTKCSKST